MSDGSSEDWLPSGWSVTVRVRRSGKKDKQYYAPSGLVFKSKVEVTRYLKTLDGSAPQPKEEEHAISDESAKINTHNTGDGEKAEQHTSSSGGSRSPQSGKEDKMRTKEFVENHNCKEVQRSSSSSGEKYNAGIENSINCNLPPVEDTENTVIEEHFAKIEEPAEYIRAHSAQEGSLCCKEEKNVDAQESERNASGHVMRSGSPSPKDKKTTPKHTPNVVVERGVAEGLPAGWIKEIKVKKKKKNTFRRDPYYIDPVSGYIFRSMKDALRYLATGDIGRLAFKPKEEDPDMELENDRSSSPSDAKRQKLENGGVKGTEDEGSEQASHLTDEQMFESVNEGEATPPPESTPDQGRFTDLRDLEPNEQRSNCGRTNCIGVSQEKQQSMDGTAETSETPNTKQATPKSQKKKSLDLPRRSSSRLAGVLADPNLEVTKTRKATVGKSDNTEINEVKEAASSSQKDELSSGPQKKRIKRGKMMSKSINELCSPVEDKLEKHHVGDEEKEVAVSLPPQEEGKIEGDVPKEELVLPFELPSGDILSDPCIEFAIKTLTGVSFDVSTAIGKSSSADKQEHASKVKEGEVASSSLNLNLNLNLPFGDSWQDPCIEFAIKTLTGAIPVDFDLDIPDLMRQQMNSSQIQESSEVALSNDNFCRTDLLWQHSEATDKKAAYRQQSGTGTAPQPLNSDMQRPSGSILSCQDHRGGKYQI